MKILVATIVIVIAGALITAGFYFGRNSDSSDSSDTALQKGVVDISDEGLGEFPKSVLSDTSATVLDLSNNNLESLPSEIGELTRLEELYLSYNALTGALPGEIRKMSKLRILDASYNNLTGIPAEIGQLSKLKELDLSYNQIDTFPNELGNLKGSLEILDLTGNTFSQDTIAKIRAALPGTEIVF